MIVVTGATGGWVGGRREPSAAPSSQLAVSVRKPGEAQSFTASGIMSAAVISTSQMLWPAPSPGPTACSSSRPAGSIMSDGPTGTGTRLMRLSGPGSGTFTTPASFRATARSPM